MFSVPALYLKNSGGMDYRRGHIQILERESPKAKACEGYE
jgi:hypothetical protein